MIDWQRVGELRDDIGDDDFREVVELFLEEVAEIVARLAKARDGSGLEADLHLLKGCALNLGFAELGAVCAAGERQAAEGGARAVDLQAVVAIYEASIARFQSGLDSNLAA